MTLTTRRIHYLQHVPFEALGFIENWAKCQNFALSCTKLYLNEQLPVQEDFDWLIIMGGPMNVYQDELYPWLSAEKAFIKETIDSNKVVLGICLGAQLIAAVLGGKIQPNEEKEIGWFPVSFRKEKLDRELSAVLPDELTVIHWHGDTFTLPEVATHFALSRACENQGFIYNDRVIALQFHLETTPESLRGLLDNCGDELGPGEWIQSTETMLDINNFRAINTAMGNLLNYLTNKF